MSSSESDGDGGEDDLICSDGDDCNREYCGHGDEGEDLEDDESVMLMRELDGTGGGGDGETGGGGDGGGDDDDGDDSEESYEGLVDEKLPSQQQAGTSTPSATALGCNEDRFFCSWNEMPSVLPESTWRPIDVCRKHRSSRD
jgi:hypothetical protein